MKKLLIALLLLGSYSSFAVTSLFCSVAEGYGDGAYYHVGLKGKAILDCSSLKFDMDSSTGIKTARKYRVEITNIGLGVFGSDTHDGGVGISILCPSVGKKSLGVDTYLNKKGVEKKGTTDFYGARASASFIVGADVAVFSSKKAGVCLLTGLSAMGGGVSVSGSKMTVTLVE